MKVFTVVVPSVMLVFLVGTVQAQSTATGGPGGGGGDALVALGPSLISPTLSTTSVGGGDYKYTVSFVNTDTSKIWHFLVYTVGSSIVPVTSSFPGYSADDPLSTVYAQYNAHNINPSLTDLMDAEWPPVGGPYPGTSGVAIGSTGSISFELSGLDASFLYAYEDLNSGWTQSNGSGDVAAYGYVGAVPEACSTAVLMALAAFGLLGFKRMVRA